MSAATTGGVQVPQPIEVLHGGGTVLACDREGRVSAEQLHGLFAGDTRVLSTYRIGVGGHEWQLLSRSRPDSATAQWNFQSPAVQGTAFDLAPGVLHLGLTRRLAGALHDDLRLCAFADRKVCLRLALHLDADFADIFEVKDRVIRSRFNVLRITESGGLTLSYERRGFRRGLLVCFHSSGPPPVFVGTLALFDLELGWGTEWTCCVDAAPIIDRHTVHFRGDPHAPGLPPAIPGANEIAINSEPLLQRPFERGRADLHSLAVEQPGCPPYPAAGVPWFLTLFGRDTLFTALMGGLDGSWLAEGSLAALGERQAKERDDWRDAEAGKLPHEIRRGELAFRGEIPHAAYYGTHDAPALYCLALWHAWCWTGKRGLLDAHLGTAQAALRWCDEAGDRDGDGLQEYATRSRRGYYNQSWKDAGDAVVHDDGRIADVPWRPWSYRATCSPRASRWPSCWKNWVTVRRPCGCGGPRELRARVEERFWMEERGFYAVALDRDKRQVASIASNPGHLLWCGLPNRARAGRVAERLLRPELFSGWGCGRSPPKAGPTTPCPPARLGVAVRHGAGRCRPLPLRTTR